MLIAWENSFYCVLQLCIKQLSFLISTYEQQLSHEWFSIYSNWPYPIISHFLPALIENLHNHFVHIAMHYVCIGLEHDKFLLIFSYGFPHSHLWKFIQFSNGCRIRLCYPTCSPMSIFYNCSGNELQLAVLNIMATALFATDTSIKFRRHY